MDLQLIIGIHKEKGTPLIGVIGATSPTEEYTPEMGMEVGCLLREYLEGRPGSIFTGGVEGVGIDVHIGLVRNCIEMGYLSREGNNVGIDDRFFVLVPKYEENVANPFKKIFFGKDSPYFKNSKDPYQPPSAYQALGKLSSRAHLDIIRAGENMAERREYVAAIADALVVVNGRAGTLDEALIALERKVPLFALRYSGGAAAILGSIRDGNLSLPLVIHQLARQGTEVRNVKNINIDGIYVCEKMSDVLDNITKLFLKN